MGNRKFKIGDRVKYTSGIYGDRRRNPLWKGKYGKIKGTLTSIIRDGIVECPLHVRWDNKENNFYRLNDLELIEEQRQLNLFGGECE